MSSGRIEKANISLATGVHTRVLLDSPVTVVAGTEYALVILCDDAQTSVAIADLGAFDASAQQWATVQPYQVGVLLSSSNASTWTAHQSRDLAFRLLRAEFTATSEVVELGTATITNATDMLLMALSEEPGAATRTEYLVTLPDEDNTQLTLAQGQPVRFDKPLSGAVAVKARLSGVTKLSPVLWPDAQLIHGAASLTADYVSRAVPAIGGTSVRVIYDALIPSGATVTPTVSGDGGAFAAMTAGSTVALDDGFREYSFSATIADVDAVKAKLTLTGTTSARPRIKNLRVMVI